MTKSPKNADDFIVLAMELMTLIHSQTKMRITVLMLMMMLMSREANGRRTKTNLTLLTLVHMPEDR